MDSVATSLQRHDPHLRRWMAFVDGENLTLRGQRIASKNGIELIEGPYYLRDVFIWLPRIRATTAITNTQDTRLPVQPHAIRAHYYTSLIGDDDKLTEVKDALWKLGFNPDVFKKTKKDEKAKGVDIALTKDLLWHAYFNNYDVAVLFSGDGDYVPVIEAVKRLGKAIFVVSFQDTGLSQTLRIASDTYYELEPFFVDTWRGFIDSLEPIADG